MANRIHPGAEVDAGADLAEGVEVGPFAVIERDVHIGERTRIFPGAHVLAGTTLGRENVVHGHVVLGGDPQDLAYDGSRTELRIGDRNVFREGVTVNRGSAPETVTSIGDDCFFMANSHVGHDCEVESNVILANGALLGGHVHVGERVFIAGNAAVHQHVRVGRLAMLAGVSPLTVDVPPFSLVADRNIWRGMNSVGLRRAGFDRKTTTALRRAFRRLFGRRRNLKTAREEIAAEGGLLPEVAEVLEFIETSKRGVCRPDPRSTRASQPDE